MVQHAREAAACRVALAVDDTGATRDIARALAVRGIDCQVVPLHRAVEIGADAIAFAPAEPPSPATAALIAPVCRDAAEADRPVVVLAAFRQQAGQAALHRAAALAYLRSSGAIVCGDPDVWLEVIALLAGHGLPAGPRAAIVAPPGGWLFASAAALEAEALALGARFPAMFGIPDRPGGQQGQPEQEPQASQPDGAGADGPGDPVDIALCDPAAVQAPLPGRAGRALIVPVVARAELIVADRDADRIPLVGLRAAVGAALAAGRFSERRRAGLGPAGPDDADALQPDLARFERQLDKLGDHAGDHEAKVLLSSWGIPVTRQAVATTPSAATRLARRAGYPVEIKPWGPDIPSEPDGCPVVRGVTTAAEVRRAVAAVARDAGLPEGHPVIVRAAPGPGREVAARVIEIGALGWTVVVEAPGGGQVAAPAPLRPIDAEALARQLEASRADDPPPDRAALADILVRASHLAVRHADTIEALHLHRIVVATAGEGSLVADASAVLRRRDE